MINFRCELCDNFLSLLQFSHLCDNCYKIRTITKCYNSETILNCLENNFLISDEEKEAFRKEDKEIKEKEQKQLEEEALKLIDNTLKPKSVEDYETCIKELKDKQAEMIKINEKKNEKKDYNLRKTKSN